MSSLAVLLLQWTLLITTLVTSFNIDIDHNYLEYSISEKETQFGYSISLIKNKGSPLIVGAPKFDGGKGAIYKCKGDQATCEKVVFYSGVGDKVYRQNHEQHLGFSISYVGKRLMACAPKFYKFSKANYSQPIGKCSVFDEDMKLSFNDIPCEDKPDLLPSFGYALAGVSSTGVPDKNNEPLYFLGTPGARAFRGHIFTSYAPDGRDPNNPKYSEEKLKDFLSYSYIGYSVSAGNILNDEKSSGDVVGGAPGGYHFLGNALLYNLKYSNFKLKANITNPEKRIGSYFGAAVVVADLNGDGKDDVLIGAPYYSKIQDEGRVYIYLNKGDTMKGDWEYDGLQLNGILEGDGTVGGRFGTTLVNLGDMNKDSFTDIAIGAPGGERGAVFIYNCGLSGIPQKPSQVIYATAVPGNPAGFGISISSGVDVDGNTYNDLAIGAYMAEKVYVFKSRAIIQLKAEQTVNVKRIPPKPEESNCAWKGVRYYCIQLELNLRYAGDGTPASFEVEIDFDIDSDVSVQKRAFIVDTSANTLVGQVKEKIRLKKAITTSISKKVYTTIRADIDMLEPIMMKSYFEAYHNPSACLGQPCGILDHYAPRSAISEVSYETKCGNDKICNPDLQVESAISFHENPGVSEIIYGVVKKMMINTTIYNDGEPAYQPKLDTSFHSDFVVVRVELNGKSHPIWNLKETKSSIKKLLIPLPTFLSQNASVNIAIIYALRVDKPSVRKYTFTVAATSAGQEVNPKDNKVTLQVGTKVETCIDVDGAVSPNFILDNIESKSLPTNANISDIGVPVKYTFYVKNDGEVPVEQMRAAVSMVTEKYGVKLACVSSVTIDDKPCLPSTGIASCQEILSNPKLYGVEGPHKMEERSLTCRNAECATLRCNIPRLDPRKGAGIKISARILNVNFAKVIKSLFETVLDITFVGPDRDIYMQRKDCVLRHNVTVTVESPIKQSAAEIPFWIIIAATIAALLLLIIIIIVLYKKKFFERKKPQAEEEPLKDPGDEDDE